MVRGLDFHVDRTVTQSELIVALTKLFSIPTEKVVVSELIEGEYHLDWAEIMKNPPAIAASIYNHVTGDFSSFIEINVLEEEFVKIPANRFLLELASQLNACILEDYDLPSPMFWAKICAGGYFQKVFANIGEYDEVKIENYLEEIILADLEQLKWW